LPPALPEFHVSGWPAVMVIASGRPKLRFARSTSRRHVTTTVFRRTAVGASVGALGANLSLGVTTEQTDRPRKIA
jgi:hypothetical protein